MKTEREITEAEIYFVMEKHSVSERIVWNGVRWSIHPSIILKVIQELIHPPFQIQGDKIDRICSRLEIIPIAGDK